METLLKTNGDPSIRSLATGLGTLGRYGDSYMVHAAEGETVVPREILEANPGLRANLFSQMRMMGVEDPTRYVVGNSLNSINPVTGQPEFFFKKIWRVQRGLGGRWHKALGAWAKVAKGLCQGLKQDLRTPWWPEQIYSPRARLIHLAKGY